MSAKRTDQLWLRPQSSPRAQRPPTLVPDPRRLPSAAGFDTRSVNPRPASSDPTPSRSAPPASSSPNQALLDHAYAPRARPPTSSLNLDDPGLIHTLAQPAQVQGFQYPYSRPNPYPPAPPGGFSPEDRALLRAGFTSAYVPPKVVPTVESPSEKTNPTRRRKSVRFEMAEPRARAARHKGQMNFGPEMRHLLLAYGDPAPHHSFSAEPLPETIRVLDEIVTDFILELCHGAAQVAHHARRQKIKVDDFRFALRRDPNKLGRVQELLRMERELKEARKAFDQNDDQVAKDAGKKGAPPVPEDDDAASVAGANTVKKGKGKGKRAAANRRGSDATEESVPKKRKTIG